jgi:hypothetical protein
VKVRYIGRSDTGVFLVLEGGGVDVAHGAEIDVPDAAAESLLEQDGQWELVTSPPEKKSGAAGSNKE